MDSRQQFEEWHGKVYGYVGATTACEDRWVVWQGAREFIVIELPEHFDKYESGDFMYWAEDVEKAIHSSGIRIK